MSFSSHFGNLVFGCFWQWSYLPKYFVIVCLLFLLSKARQAKQKFKVKKSCNHNDEKTKNEVTKIYNEFIIHFKQLQKWNLQVCNCFFFASLLIKHTKIPAYHQTLLLAKTNCQMSRCSQKGWIRYKTSTKIENTGL